MGVTMRQSFKLSRSSRRVMTNAEDKLLRLGGCFVRPYRLFSNNCECVLNFVATLLSQSGGKG